MRFKEFSEDAYSYNNTATWKWSSLTPEQQAEWTRRQKTLESRVARMFARLQGGMNPEDLPAVKGVKTTVPLNGEMAWAAADYPARTLSIDLGTFWDLSDDCLAYVMGHEIGHFVYEAGHKNYWKQKASPAQNRQYELDADAYGALLAYKLGFNPSRAFDDFTREYQREPFDPKYPNYPSVGQRKANFNKAIQGYKDQQNQPKPEPGTTPTAEPTATAPQQEPQAIPEPPVSPAAKEDMKHAMRGIQQLGALLKDPQIAQGPMPAMSDMA